MIIETNELEGNALDWAVAGLTHAEKWRHDKYEGGLLASMHGYCPSTNWAQGGPLMNQIGSLVQVDGEWYATHINDGTFELSGQTPLIAAMRAIVAEHVGEKVNVPDELLEYI